jgi:hypothetical protein
VAVRGSTEGKEVANLFPPDLVVIREREYFLAVSNKIFHKVFPECYDASGGVCLLGFARSFYRG